MWRKSEPDPTTDDAAVAVLAAFDATQDAGLPFSPG